VIVAEGPFDAISIEGCALLGAEIKDSQNWLLKQLNKEIVLVPDRDITGLKLCNRALELGYKVSIPNWESDVKDVNDAVVRYGKLPTLLSILQWATTSKVKIEIQRRKLEQRI
jgi:DNA primase